MKSKGWELALNCLQQVPSPPSPSCSPCTLLHLIPAPLAHGAQQGHSRPDSAGFHSREAGWHGKHRPEWHPDPDRASLVAGVLPWCDPILFPWHLQTPDFYVRFLLASDS